MSSSIHTCSTVKYYYSRNKRVLRDIKAQPTAYTYGWSCPLSLKLKCSCGVGSERSCGGKQGFGDEEDFLKAGGSELLFVQMQQNKAMDNQSKLADKLPQISSGDSMLDLVVIGCGPAGLALAPESAKLGLNVGLIGPDLPFTNNYGVWEDEFKDLGLERCIEHVWPDTIVYIDEGDLVRLGRAYGRVSRHLLHEELLIRLATVASGAASGKLLQYDRGGPMVLAQTSYGVEAEEGASYMKQKGQCLEEQYPTFLYAMPISPTRVFFEETCLASEDVLPFDLLKKKLMSRDYIPVGGSLPIEQKNLAFGAAASMVHPTTGYSIVRSLSEAPKYASVIANIIKDGHSRDMLSSARSTGYISMKGCGRDFLASTLSSTDLMLLALYMFVIAPNDLRMCLIRHLLSDPTGATMLRTYLTI
ncbi:unnamed protein product [Ilex paraguariensis]|uniref:Lycopene epsilon cyclase n=1 Tax=Ilex paraguariensis TaxID=185542 RepID=A0ABC8RNC5_9AQUA